MKASFGLKLSHKGFILIAVPLFFELLLLSFLMILLIDMEKKADKLDRSKTVVQDASQLISLYVDAANSLTGYAFKKDPKLGDQYDRDIMQLTDSTRELLKVVADDQAQLLTLERLAVEGDRLIEITDAVKSSIDNKQSDSLYDTQSRVMEAHALLDRLIDQLRKFVHEEQLKQLGDPDKLAKSRMLVNLAIGGGVVVSILIALALAILFNSGTATRLKRLMENTSRLAEQQPLYPEIGGSDELAHLDAVFHQMAETLAEASRKERAVVDNAQDVICSLDATGTFLKVNPASMKVWGYDSKRLLGKPLMMLVFKDDAEQTVAWLESVKNDNLDSSFENRVMHKDRSLVYTLWSAYWSQADEAIFCVAHNITARKQLEQHKQELVAMVSHDLRSPIGAIHNFLLLLTTGNVGTLNEMGNKLSKAAERSCKRLIALINDLLDLERLEAGEMPMEFSVVSMRDVFERSVDSVGPTADAEQVILEIDGAGVEAYADGDRLVQVLVNLISNAIKYSPKGGTVSLTAERLDDQVEIRVTDQGRGIPAHLLDSVFERFQQVEMADAKKKGGTGLGLAICRAIVDQHHGSIGVLSEEGKGSTFWFRIPVGLVSNSN